MGDQKQKEIKNITGRRQVILPVSIMIIGLLMNMGGKLVASMGNLPIYMDTPGTIMVALLGGYVPGMAVALISNLIGNLMDGVSIYYAPISVLVAVVTVHFSKKGLLDKFRNNVIYVLILSLIGGGIGGILTWYLNLQGVNSYNAGIIHFLQNLGFGEFFPWFIANILFDIADKAVTVTFVRIIVYLIPRDQWSKFELVGWMQEPYHISREKSLFRFRLSHWNLNNKIIAVLIVFSVMTATVCTSVSLILFRNYSVEQHSYLAEGVAKMVAGIVDGDSVNRYLSEGEISEDYKETEKILTNIYNNSPDVSYVYVYKIMSDGCHVVFDVDTDEVEGADPGEVIAFDESFMVYVPDLLSGKRIEPIISDDSYGWLLTYYEPVFDSNGSCVAYAGVDIAMSGLRTYELEFVIKSVLIFTGFLMLFFAIVLWFTKFQLILPINAMSRAAGKFEYDDVYARKNNVKELADLKICTDDEIEKLYKAFLKTTEESMRYFEENQEKLEKIDKMQNSLILVLADMVENRDEGTGDHIRKTAAYVEITARKMKELGYYKDRLSETFIENCVKSAPLHDIGKISISDVILNKPGKLTDDEFEIMKTHTSAGKKVIEQVIATMPDADYLEEAKNVAGYHHEKWNGKGYPEGLAGEEIPLSARIMAVADVFDALVSKRCYKDSFSYREALDMIKDGAGSHFDPLVADAFLKSEAEVTEVADRFAAREGK